MFSIDSEIPNQRESTGPNPGADACAGSGRGSPSERLGEGPDQARVGAHVPGAPNPGKGAAKKKPAAAEAGGGLAARPYFD